MDIGPENLRAADISEAEKGSYFHISPFTTADYKELSPQQLVELIIALQKNFPEKKLALSCAPTPREQAKMEKLLALLPQKPWRVFAGNLSLIQVAAVIQHSALHFCGDTGTLHLALMTQSPATTWFWPNPAMKVWISPGEHCRVLVGANLPGTAFLSGISTDTLVEAAKTVLSTS